ncbi:F-box domain-containing protein [Fusarium sp. LHS14.1]|nr:F-box domain-containing protein [Fusarium sp. LHS14.1]
MRLDILPTEVQCSFIRLLDPIGLISLSQTSKHFRLLINPTKEHLAERLLQLETLEEYGGFTPSDKYYSDYLLLNYCQRDRKDILWACTSCPRLLPRRCFSNMSILGLPYQKPARHDPLPDKATSWEPVVKGEKVREDWRNPQVESHKENPLPGSGFYSLWARRRATNRQNRRCLECQYDRGELRPPRNGLYGNEKVPVQVNRTALFYTELDRYFPGVSDYLGCEIPPAVENVLFGGDSPAAIKPFTWEMHMVRCPKCTRWKELRDFRLQVRQLHGARYREEEYERYDEGENGYFEDVDTLLKDACCNACFAKAHGRVELGRALGSWFRELVDGRLQATSFRLRAEVRRFHLDMPLYSEIMKLMQSMTELEEKLSCFDLCHDSVLNEEDIAQLKAYRAHAIHMWEQRAEDGHWPMFMRPPPDQVAWGWVHNFCEDVLRDLKTLKETFGENPEAFAAWALDRDEATWDCEVEGALTRELGPDVFSKASKYMD